jgi:hypothetical protein
MLAVAVRKLVAGHRIMDYALTVVRGELTREE